MENKFWVARDKSGELYLYNEKPECYNDCKVWFAGGICARLDKNNVFPDLTFEDEPLEVELRLTTTDLDIKAQEYANSVTDNKELREMIVNAFKARYNI